MPKSIQTDLGLVLGLLLILGFLSVGTTLWAVQSQSADALVINAAGSERWLSQRVAKLALLGAQPGQDPRYRAEMESEVHKWEQTFLALRDGGQIVYPDRTVSLPPTTDPTIRAQLERVWSLWKPFDSAAHAILENPPASPAFVQGLADVDALSDSILREMDQTVQLYETVAAARVTRVGQIQLVFLFAGAVVVVFSFGLIRSQIIRPLALLGAAVKRISAGDLVTPIPKGLSVLPTVQNEIGALAVTFDEMRQHLHEQLERITALHDIDVAITAALNLKETLNVLLEKVMERLHVDTAAIALAQPVKAAAVAFIRPETLELIYVATRGLGGEFFKDGLLKVKEGIAGQVADSGTPIAIPDVRAEPRFVRRSIAEKLGVVSYLAVPLRAAQELGVAPARCVAIEDSETGIASAKAAGLRAIAVPNCYTAHQDLSRADARVGSLGEVMALLAPESPLFK